METWAFEDFCVTSRDFQYIGTIYKYVERGNEVTTGSGRATKLDKKHQAILESGIWIHSHT